MIFQWVQASGKDHKQIQDKISKQPISTKQFVALSVYTNQQYIKYLEMNTRRNRIWVRIPRITRSILGQPWLQLLISRFLCVSPKNPPIFFSLKITSFCLSLVLSLLFETLQCMLPILPLLFPAQKKSSHLLHSSFLFIFVPASQKLNMLNEIHFPFFYFPSFLKIRISLPFLWRALSSHVCSQVNLFIPRIFLLVFFECAYLCES